jgi:hypothetical protein
VTIGQLKAMTCVPNFVFSPTVFVLPGDEQESGEWSPDDLSQIEKIRSLHPELQHWGNLAIGCAWGAYSQDIMAVGWMDREQFDFGRNLGFLAYLYVRQLAPSFDFLGTGLFSEDIHELGKQEPWRGNNHVPPEWAARR